MEYFYNNIDEYINDKLSDEERSTFEKIINEDKILRQEFINYKELRSSISADDLDFIEKLSQAERLYFDRQENKADQNRSGQSVIRILNYAKPILLAASLIFIIGLSWLYFTSPENYAELAQSNFKSIDMPVQMSDQANKNSIEMLIYNGSEAVKNKNYAAAINNFQNAYIKSKNNNIKAKSKWYLALIHLYNDRPNLANKELNEIISLYPESVHFKEAKKLMKAIRKLEK